VKIDVLEKRAGFHRLKIRCGSTESTGC